MDKNTLSNYGWIVICVLVLSVIMALATPFGIYVKTAIENTTDGLFETEQNALAVVGASIENQSFNPKIVEGDGQILKKDEPVEFYFRSTAPVDTFKTVKIDGKPVESKYYTVTEGSTIVTFTGEYAKMLSLGTHSLEIVSNDGYVDKSATASFSKGNFIPDGATYTVKNNGQTLTGGMEFPASVSGNDVYTYGDYKYTAKGSFGWKVEINTGVTDKKQTSYGPIMDKINDVPVTNLQCTFQDCTALTVAPIIPSSVEGLSSTFSGCKSLTTAPDLSNCTKLVDISSTFYNCTSLKTGPSVIPSGVKSLYYTFYNCKNLTNAPDLRNCTEMQTMLYSFYNCNSLTTAPEIPSGVTSMDHTFYNCKSLTTTPKIPNGILNLNSTFSGCKSLTTAPDLSNCTNLYEINSTFSGCSSLTNPPKLPNRITNMNSTFRDCTALTTAPEIPNSVKNMQSTFYGTAITKAPTIPSGVTNMTYTFVQCALLTDISALVIPSGVTDLNSTFSGCKSLTTAPTIPSGVTNMPYTFAGCTALDTKPTIPSSVTTAESSIFKNCTQFGY